MALPPGARRSLVLLAVCLALGAVLALQWRAWAPAPAGPGDGAPPSEPIAEAVAPGTPYSPPARDSFDEILKRPLFSPDRQPPAAPPTPAAPEPQLSPLLVRLEGIATVGEVRVALLRDLTSNEGLRLSQGMEYQGWKVEAVEERRAVLKRDGQEQELKLERQ